ncbi:hypothetical protein WR25_10821 isoform B [Diploscapter pachys]|uniref:SEA domain-containing protein n=1 Tax=Diploscapter pachys TaxID=2018661 RepID=A0A2A2JAW8_9BILA|nr:hypothetical protein WR25_10821 isoform B [Diploscapter pachys]
MSSVKMEDFVSLLAQLSSTDVRRFRAAVKCPSPMNCLNVTLRPPFLESHLSNSYTIQSISRVVNQKILKASSSSQAIISSFNYTVVQRNLTGDGHARKVIMDIESLYQAVVGDNSSHLETKWAESIASTLRIDIRRIKKPSVARGIIYNFTVTLPFEEEPALSAEEITLMLLESTKYGELTLLGEKGQPVNISPLTYDNLVELQVIKETNALVIVLSIVISTTLVIFLLFLSGAVLVKIRTDRVIEEVNFSSNLNKLACQLMIL